MAGFTYYDDLPSTGPTTAEILAALTSEQKTAVLNGFIDDIPVTELKHQAGIPSFAIRHLYTKIDAIEETSRGLMGSASPPADANELIDAVKNTFSDDFDEPQVIAILTAMVNYSKHDGSGTWAYYRAEVTK